MFSTHIKPYDDRNACKVPQRVLDTKNQACGTNYSTVNEQMHLEIEKLYLEARQVTRDILDCMLILLCYTSLRTMHTNAFLSGGAGNIAFNPTCTIEEFGKGMYHSFYDSAHDLGYIDSWGGTTCKFL